MGWLVTHLAFFFNYFFKFNFFNKNKYIKIYQ